MNINNIAAIVDEKSTTIAVRYAKNGQIYVHRIMKDLALTIVPKDKLIVECSGGIKVVTVVEVHEESEIDADGEFSYKWAFMKVDMEALETLRNGTNKTIKLLRAEQRRHLREKMIASLGVSVRTRIEEAQSGETI